VSRILEEFQDATAKPTAFDMYGLVLAQLQRTCCGGIKPVT